MTLARLDRVTKRFGARVALRELSVHVREGEVVTLLGPNGAGKSTALAVLLGLRRPDEGSASLLGGDPRDPAFRRLVGVTPQETIFPATLRVRELVELVRAHYRAPLAAGLLAERFGLGRLLERQAGGLSGGERRRVGVALAFAGDPRLVVLDEPTAGLDGEGRAAVWAAVRAHASAGGAVLLTTHHLEEADALAHRLVLVEDGSVVADGPPATIKAAAGLTRVSFRAPTGRTVDGAERDGEYLRLLVRDGGEAVARLVRDGIPLDELEVRPLSLEEALRARRGIP